MNSITNVTELRAAATLLTANVNRMCNSANNDETIKSFVDSKDLLIAIYKFCIDRNQK